MKILLKKLHCYFYMAIGASLYVLAFPFLYLSSLNPAYYKAMNSIRRIWGFSSSMLAGIFYRFTYEEPINWNKTYIICPNHSSNLDATSMSIMVNNNYCFMGKEELSREFATRLFFKSIDIAVNRDSKMSAFRAFKTAAERLAKGMTLIIFPEGKIPTVYPPKLDEFKNGPFRLAIELKVPIIPISSIDTWKVLWDTGLKFGSKPGICDIFVHKPIETAHLTIDDADALRDQVHSIINQKLIQQ